MDKLTCPCSTLSLLSWNMYYQIRSYLKQLRIDEQIGENLSHNGCKTILILHALHKQKHVQSMEKHCILGNESIKKVPTTSIVPKENLSFHRADLKFEKEN